MSDLFYWEQQIKVYCSCVVAGSKGINNSFYEKRSGYRHLRPFSSRVSCFERILSGFWHASAAIFLIWPCILFPRSFLKKAMFHEILPFVNLLLSFSNTLACLIKVPRTFIFFGIFSVPDALIKHRTFNYFFDLSFQDVY